MTNPTITEYGQNEADQNEAGQMDQGIDQVNDGANVQSNVDNQEVNKFNNKASNWWDIHGEFKPLHDMNPLRLDYVQSKVLQNFKSPLKNKRVLDVGCGGGILTESLARAGANVDGIDMAEEALKVAKLHLYESELSINYHCTSVEDFAEKNEGEFDIICCLEMLEHVPNPQSVIKSCVKLLKPGGLLFISTINRTAKSYAYAIVGAEYVLKLLPKGTHNFKKFIKPSEIDIWARKVGLVILHLTGMHYNPLNKHFSLAEGLDVNYIGCLQKPA